jgi:hypothetical protein
MHGHGHYLSCDGKHCKVPEWCPVDKFDKEVSPPKSSKKN